jgi:hypothetical protein
MMVDRIERAARGIFPALVLGMSISALELMRAGHWLEAGLCLLTASLAVALSLDVWGRRREPKPEDALAELMANGGIVIIDKDGMRAIEGVRVKPDGGV